jgi:hypothetical protein
VFAAGWLFVLVFKILDKYYPNKRIGHGGQISLPLKSPELSLLGMSLWGFVKDFVYVPDIPICIDMMKIWIT